MVFAAEQLRQRSDERRAAGDPADKEVQGDVPGPGRLLDRRHIVVRRRLYTVAILLSFQPAGRAMLQELDYKPEKVADLP